MTKNDLIEAVQQACPGQELSKKDTGDVIDAVFDTMGTAIKKEERFSYPNFGTFKVTKRAARKGRNPRTGAEIKIKASKTVKFAPAPKFKEEL
ncbi:MAG: HU family DNA-binding protein [Candidatus Tectomicrobia bacterium]|nr:HU family DNA-binding protein [Candidatus Tectomicrobia bacterium]